MKPQKPPYLLKLIYRIYQVSTFGFYGAMALTWANQHGWLNFVPTKAIALMGIICLPGAAVFTLAFLAKVCLECLGEELLLLLKNRQPRRIAWTKLLHERLQSMHELTTRALGREH